MDSYLTVTLPNNLKGEIETTPRYGYYIAY